MNALNTISRSARVIVARPRPRSAALVFALALQLSASRASSSAEATLDYKYENYREAGGRIRVAAHYARADLGLGAATRLGVRGVVDVITGASPTGAPAAAGDDQVPLGALEDERRAIVVDAARQFGANTLRLEYAHSREDDYISNGGALSWIRSVNEKNTDVQLGFSFNDDRIQPVFFAEARRKRSWDALAGVTQLLGPNTTLTANLSLGGSRGYLSDPYKIVQKTIELAPGLSLPLTFPENRPDQRAKGAAFIELRHYFAPLRGSIEHALRLYRDDHGVSSKTWELAWYQRFGDSLIVKPLARFYTQSAADYYLYDLDRSPLTPVDQPDALTPHYSSDYRLSAFEATTLGLKLVYQRDHRWSVDLGFERYEMRGRDGLTPQSAYAEANIVTVGTQFSF